MREDPAATLSEVSDAWLVGRARELNAAGQHSEPSGQHTTIREADNLLLEAQRRGEPRIVAQLLRHCASMRLANIELTDEADPLLDELLNHTRRHGLEVLQADAHALRGKRALLGGSEDNALTEVARGLAMLDDELAPDRALGRRSWERLLATSLIDLGLVLTQLGVYEMADEVMARAHQRIRESGGPHEIAVHMINRCRMQLAWGLRLERVGHTEEAASQFSTASAIAVAVEAPWRESLFPRVSNRSASEQMPVLGAAHALDSPGAENIPKLEELRHVDRSMHPREQILVAIALARCLVRSDHRDEAIRVLSETLNNLMSDTSEQTLRISLARELAMLNDSHGRPRDSLRTYATELETELWAMREARVSTLVTRLENSRLSHKHDAITRQAREDPLTGLCNRRALDDRLETLLNSASEQPLAVALVDLDGFKGVNDRCSHAEGDDVLRTVARTLRETLRTDDFLARYGGDEFVVLLPGATLDAAEAALSRTVTAVDRLPAGLSRGVTLSIGVVSMRPLEPAAQALARADAAMYQAKRNGGNRVSALSGTLHAEERHSSAIDQGVWTPPDAR
ncbi:GGDEF domain-containing protein [Saccharopolyspora halophila]|uniref:GGDEF domain-containing protein n=1 Tax=Saccharopolyspora halophila TaxID=405551 RepID=UPI0031D9F5E6